MLTEKSRNKALEAFLKGRKVIVMTVFDDGSIAAERLEDILMTEDRHYQVDVPAVENPEFGQAVAEMVGQKQEEPAKEKSSTPPTGPEVSEMLPAGKTKKEIALEMASQGKTAAQIAKETGMAYNTVYYYLNPDKCRPKKKTEEISVNYKNPDAHPGWNADRKKCKTCRYRQAHNNPTDLNKGNCNYIEIAGHSRGCAVEDCDRYVKGARMDRKRKCAKI